MCLALDLTGGHGVAETVRADRGCNGAAHCKVILITQTLHFIVLSSQWCEIVFITTLGVLDFTLFTCKEQEKH